MLCGAPHNISMLAMRQEGITAILTHDTHFVQEGFAKLL
jgi:predicted nucleic acid-binding protein